MNNFSTVGYILDHSQFQEMVFFIGFMVIMCYKNQGPFRLVAEEGKSKCSWVSLDDVSNILVRGILHFCFCN
jgi:hypothetical protein